MSAADLEDLEAAFGSGDDDEDRGRDNETGNDGEDHDPDPIDSMGTHQRLEHLRYLRTLMPNASKTNMVVLRDMTDHGDKDAKDIAVLLMDEIAYFFKRPDEWRGSMAKQTAQKRGGRAQILKHTATPSKYMAITDPLILKQSRQALKPLLPHVDRDVLYACALETPYLRDLYWMNTASEGGLDRIFCDEKFWCDKLAADARRFNQAVKLAGDKRHVKEPFFQLTGTTKAWEEMYRETCTACNVVPLPVPKRRYASATNATTIAHDDDVTMPIHVEKYRIFGLLEMSETWQHAQRQQNLYRYNYRNMYWLQYLDNWIAVQVQRWAASLPDGLPNTSLRSSPLSLKGKVSWRQIACGVSQLASQRPTGIPVFDGFARYLMVSSPKSAAEGNRPMTPLELAQCFAEAFISFKTATARMGRGMDLPNFYFDEPRK